MQKQSLPAWVDELGKFLATMPTWQAWLVYCVFSILASTLLLLAFPLLIARNAVCTIWSWEKKL